MTILMIRPVGFAYNSETAVNNAFQTAGHAPGIQGQALAEFDHFVDTLRAIDIDILTVEDTPVPQTPDSIFPNNWVSFHEDGTAVLYPMFATNRRLERKRHVIEAIEQEFVVRRWLDYTAYEQEGRFLEGTGSMVLDRRNRLAYACCSPRTDEALFRIVCAELGYQPILFRAEDDRGIAVYHTNVLMCVTSAHAIVNLEAIASEDRDRVVGPLRETGKVLVPLTHAQMRAFAGNMLEIENRWGRRYLVMSESAFQALRADQRAELESATPLVHAPLPTVERYGGGSARCMMAELFLPKK